jgi:prepilin-type N-terminal cleavage/methylation domain-containing protein
MRARRGFTLVELSIVLVIIGLIIGGVLKGRELMNNAKAKRVLNDLKAMETLAFSFYDRYGRLPGDGDLNGEIDGNNLNWQLSVNLDDSPTNTFLSNSNTDPDAPYAELEKAQLIPVAPHRTTAKHVFNGGFFFMNTDLDGVGKRDNVILVENVPCYVAKIVDTAIDSTINAQSGKIIETTGGTVSTSDTWSCTDETAPVEFVYSLD